MRVGFDGRSLSSPAGGVRRYASELLAALRRVEPHLQLTLFGAPSDLSLSPGTERSPVRCLAPTNLGWSLIDLPRAVRKSRPDIFHAPAYTAPLRGVHPLVLTIHDVSYERHPEWYPYKRDPVRRWFYRRSALVADRIITDSEFSRAEIQDAYPVSHERLRVVPLGVGAPFTAPVDVRSLPDGVREPYLLHVGDLHPRRNLKMIIRVMGRLASRHQFVLAGTDRGEGAALMEEARKSSVGLRIVTPKDDPTLARLYARAVAFVYPSRYEGFGLPLLEAMVCGTPVIAARAASIPEVVGDAGILADPDSEDDFGDAIARVLTDGALAERLRQAGRARAAEFSWERTARQTLAVYRELVG